MQYRAILAEYEFTRPDGEPMSSEQARQLDGYLAGAIEHFAQRHNLMVTGGSLLECHEPAPAGAKEGSHDER